MNGKEKNQLLKIANILYENIKPIIDFIYEIGGVINNIIIDLFECIKEILTTKVSEWIFAIFIILGVIGTIDKK